MKKLFFATLLTLELISMTVFNSSLESKNITHADSVGSFLKAKQNIIAKIKSRGPIKTPNGCEISAEEQLILLDQLSSFDLGKFLIQHGSINGYWTDYAVKFPESPDQKKNLSELENFILTKAPVVLATQERFQIFKAETQKRIKSGCVLASIPSGLMSDLLDLDFCNIENYTLVGIDIDEKSHLAAKYNAIHRGLDGHCIFEVADAWNLKSAVRFDLITSNGLNIYQKDDEQVIELYKNFCNALKPEGVLITSFLTPPPSSHKECPWAMESINMKDAFFQKVLLVDLIDAKFQTYRTKEETEKQLKEAGFSRVEFIDDNARIFPTVIAYKNA